MHHYFWCGVEINDFLFKGVNIVSWKGMLLACIITALLSYLLFAITLFKEALHCSVQKQGQAFVQDEHILQVWTSSRRAHMIQTISSLIQVTLGYFIMLIVMSYNVYLVSSALSGSLLAYFSLNPVLLKKRGLLIPPMKHRNTSCQVDECGSLIDEQGDDRSSGSPRPTDETERYPGFKPSNTTKRS